MDTSTAHTTSAHTSTAHADSGAGATRGARAETARVRGEALAGKVKELLHEGNVRRITIRNDEGHTVMEIPVTAGVVAAVVAPVLVAVAAIAALANSWEIEIDRGPAHAPESGDAPSTGDGSAR